MTPFDNDDFFGNDSFENLVRGFFEPNIRRQRSNQVIQGEQEDRTIDFIEDDGYVYIIFELPGYNENDINVLVKGNELEIKAKKKECDIEKVQDYLSQKLCRGVFIKKVLPKFIVPKNFKSTMHNCILEIKFIKK